MSYNCDQREEQDGKAPHEQSETNEDKQEVSGGQPPAIGDDSISDDSISDENCDTTIDSSANEVLNRDSNKEDMDYDDRAKNLKRQHATDSDSDKAVSARRTRLKPVPNISTKRRADKKLAKASDKLTC